MHGHGTRQVSPPRSLTTAEPEILRKLVAEISGSVQVLDCQMRHVKVIEECSVGCGTVALAVDEEACPSLDNQGGAPSSGLGADEHGSPIEVLSLPGRVSADDRTRSARWGLGAGPASCPPLVFEGSKPGR